MPLCDVRRFLKTSCRRAKHAIAVSSLLLGAAVTFAAPQGGQIAGGAGEIVTQGDTTTITQSSTLLSLSWKSFDLAANESVNFVQPSAQALAINRISDVNGTQILGRLQANGQIFLINPDGILFGPSAQINVGGMVASTLDFDEASVDRDAKSFRGAGFGRVVNDGALRASEAGYIALLGRHAHNQGTITAPGGTVAIGAGSEVTLTFDHNRLVAMQVDQSVLNNLAENGGVIRADGGKVLLSAGAKNELLASVVNNTGVIQARRVENRGGTIVLLGGMKAGAVNLGGTLDASASGAGDGGFVETSAAHVRVGDAAVVTTAAVSGEAGTWLIDPVDFTIAASGGDMTGATLSASLGVGSVAIQSVNGGAGTAGDVNVNDPVTWTANKLTLNAQNNINLNANLNASGTASLALEFGQGAVAAGNVSDVITTGAVVNLPAGTSNFTTKQGSDGSVKAYTVITSLGSAGSVTGTDLQGMNGNLAANYALGANIDAAITSGWNSGAGFQPIGSNATRFTGTFEGLGHTVSGLVFNRTGANPAALFSAIASGAMVRNVGLVGGSMTSDATGAGSLVGLNSGTVSNSYATSPVRGYHVTGGLVGTNEGVIRNSYATGTSTSYSLGEAGGLVGWNKATGSIVSSRATGNVSSSAGSVGGLTGTNAGSISRSHATGSATGTNNVGGLAGNSTGPITDSYARGAVNGSNFYTGGLVGLNSGAITQSYSASVVRGSTNVGGLVGRNTGPIQRSYASGTVYGANRLGGLAGVNTTTITNSYSTATVTSSPANQDLFGGLVGENSGNITNAYASGAMSVFPNNAGGLIGFNSGGAITNSYWNTQTTGRATSSGGTGRTTAQMRQQANFNLWDFTTIWTIYEGTSFPLLRSLMTPLTVTANNHTRTYTGVAYSGGNGVTYSSLINGVAPAGTLSYSGAAQGKTTVGSYSLTPGGLQSNQLYLITFVDGLLAINKAPLTVTANPASRLYGQANPSFTATLSGFVNGETALTAAGLSGSPTVTSDATATTNAGTAAITAGFGTLTATNYAFTNLVNGTLTIEKAPLTVTAGNASRLYGQDNPVFTTTLSGFVNGETVGTAAGLSGTASATSTATATTTVGTAAITAGAGSFTATNYVIASSVDGTLTIGKAPLTVAADNTSRLYGQANPSFTATLSGFVNGETALTAAGLSGGANLTTTATPTTTVGTTPITANVGTLAATNYAFTDFVNGLLTIEKAPLTVTAANASRLYGQANPTFATTLSGFVNGETAATAAGLSGTPSATSTATATTTVGAAAITAGAGSFSSTNYVIASGVDGLLTIEKAPLTITADNASRLYGQANPAFTATLSGFVNGETMTTAAGLSGSANLTTTATPTTTVGTAVIAADVGTLAATNYVFSNRIDGILTINKAALTLAANNASRLYGQENPSFTTTLSGFVNGETAETAAGFTGSANVTSAATAATDAGTSTLVVGAGTLGATNYEFTSFVNGTLTINRTPLTITANAARKVYDGQGYLGGNGVSYVGFVPGEDSAVLGGSLSYAGSSQGASNTGNYLITPQGLSSHNYELSFTSGELNIDRAALFLEATVASKVYDGTTTAVVTVDSFRGLVGSETLRVTGSGSFDTKEVGAGKAVSATYVLMDGTGLTSNYAWTADPLTGAIVPAPLTVEGSQAANKIYDATTNATITAGSLTGLIAGETLGLTAIGTFGGKDVGVNKPVTVSYVLGDSLGKASNYTVGPSTLSATISPRSISVGGLVASNKVYDGTLVAPLSGSAFVTPLPGDRVSVAGAAVGLFADRHVGSGKSISLSGMFLSGIDAWNYALQFPTNLSANITPASLQITGLSVNPKVYDGTVLSTLSGDAAVATFPADDVSVSGPGRAEFADSVVGVAKPVSVDGFTLVGAEAGNYVIVQPFNLSANIIPPPRILAFSPLAQLRANRLRSSERTNSTNPGLWPNSVSADASSGADSATMQSAVILLPVSRHAGLTLNVVGEGMKLPANRVSLKE